LKYSHKVRKDDPTLEYKVQTCIDLTAGGWVDTDTTTEVEVPGTEYDTISHTIPSGGSQSYIRLKVTNQ